MGVMEKCKIIGEELRGTEEGKKAIEIYKSIIDNFEYDIDRQLFMADGQVKWGLHFYVTDAVVSLLKLNTNNEPIKESVNRILGNSNISDCVLAMNQIGKFVEQISICVFQNQVQYYLPTQVHATPKLIRAVQDLSVQCQKTKVLQKMLKQMQLDKDINKIIEELDKMKRTVMSPPYSKDHREIIKKIYAKGYKKENVELVYCFFNIIDMINQTIYDSFMDRIFQVKEEELISFRKKQIGDLELVKFYLVPDNNTFEGKDKWIIRVERNDGKVLYGQIFNKYMRFSKEGTEVKEEAIIYLLM